MGFAERKLGSRPVNPLATPTGMAVFALLVAALVGGYFLWQWAWSGGARTVRLQEYLRDPAAHADWGVTALSRCPGAPLAFPTTGYIGYFWGDVFKPLQKHSGLDIFGGREPGQTPVYAAADGFLTRLPDWKSAVIIRLPVDPLQGGRSIWLYYAHMADPAGRSFISAEFPPGTSDAPVKTGTLVGYQGNYSGDPGSPTGVHLHFSIVLANSDGGFRNETDIANTLDPSPYFGIALNSASASTGNPGCR